MPENTPLSDLDHFYSAFGLQIASVFAIPELTPSDASRPVDLKIEMGTVPLSPESQEKPQMRFEVRETGLYVEIPRVARFLVSGGASIRIDPHAAATEEIIRIFLLGVVMGVLLHQRGYYTFHASAAVVGGGAVAFMGSRGYGKSTLTAAFQASGHEILTDDILAIRSMDGQLWVQPAFPRLKLMPDSSLYLGEEPVVQGELHPALRKHSLYVHDSMAPAPCPLRRIYLLDKGEKIAIEPIEGARAIREILPHWYLVQFGLEALRAQNPAAFLEQSATIARTASLRRLVRSNTLEDLPQLLDLIQADLETE
jgi:hypothetical protein